MGGGAPAQVRRRPAGGRGLIESVRGDAVSVGGVKEGILRSEEGRFDVASTKKAQLVVDREYSSARWTTGSYGSFIEHLGRAVYGGIYEPGHPTSGRDGLSPATCSSWCAAQRAHRPLSRRQLRLGLQLGGRHRPAARSGPGGWNWPGGRSRPTRWASNEFIEWAARPAPR